MVERAASFSAVTEALYDLIADREASFTMDEARRLDSVIRAKSLLMSTAASFLPLAYRDGQALDIQPRVVSKPDPFHTRYDHVAMTVDSLIEDGCAFWALGNPDDVGRPRTAYVLPHGDVQVTWDERMFLPVYHWRGRLMVPGVDILHITIGRRPGELHGRGPLREGLDRLAAVLAAEEYARAFFTSGGIPPIVLKAVNGVLTAAEAATARTQLATTRPTGGEPLVLGRDWDVSFPPSSPQTSQMQESRSYGATIVARLLGIPGALLHVETSGATITYTNPAGAMEELVKTTLAPLYLAPIEAAWSELLPSTASVRFDLNDMQRADIGARFALYASGIASGFMVPAEARAAEGWTPTSSDTTSHQFDPTPSEAIA